MYCTQCGNTETKVLDSRVSDDGLSIKRRRECLNCSNRFNTFEKYEKVSLIVEKSLGKLEDFNDEKMLESITKAFNKRGLNLKTTDTILSNIYQKLSGKRKITSKELGDIILEELKQVDEVAYIRYASVYYTFKDAKDFIEFIENKFQKKS